MSKKNKNNQNKIVKEDPYIGKNNWQKFWYFIWEDDSIWSWLANIVLAFILIKFIVYPGLGFVFQTTHPIVAVVSGSMEHKIANDFGTPIICGIPFDKTRSVNFNSFWQTCGQWYENNNISKEEFKTYKFRNGFNKGDIMILFGTKPEKVKPGDVIVFMADRADPIIHRVINTNYENKQFIYQTKGDHNSDSGAIDKNITPNHVIGKAAIRVPYLGWIKIMFVETINTITTGIRKVI